jgi:hypothetical protein
MSGFSPYDKGKKARATRQAVTLNKEPKARAKSRIPKKKAGYKRRKK